MAHVDEFNQRLTRFMPACEACRLARGFVSFRFWNAPVVCQAIPSGKGSDFAQFGPARPVIACDRVGLDRLADGRALGPERAAALRCVAAKGVAENHTRYNSLRQPKRFRDRRRSVRTRRVGRRDRASAT